MNRRGAPRIAALALLFALLAFASCLVQIYGRGRLANPVADETQYLAYGRTLAETGSFAATLRGPSVDPGPGREPGYPLLVAAVIRLDPALRAGVASCLAAGDDPRCVSLYNGLRIANAGLFAGAAAAVVLTALALNAPLWVASLAGAYTALNFQGMREARYVMSDPLALFLAALLALALALAMRRPGSAPRWLWVGLAAGILTLTKAIFLFYCFGLGAVLFVLALRRRDRAAMGALLAFALGAGVPLGGWAERNRAEYGRLALTDGRGAIVLSAREAFTHMTPGEYAASFVWWTRGPGNALARRLLPEKDWHRLELYAPDGFYMQGQFHRYGARVADEAPDGQVGPEANARISWRIVREIAARPFAYLASVLPLFYRGLWVDEFVVIGFPALVWWAVLAFRRRRWHWLAAASPTVFSLFVYAALTINMQRYQLPSIVGLALATGFALPALAVRWRHRREEAARIKPG